METRRRRRPRDVQHVQQGGAQSPNWKQRSADNRLKSQPEPIKPTREKRSLEPPDVTISSLCPDGDKIPFCHFLSRQEKMGQIESARGLSLGFWLTPAITPGKQLKLFPRGNSGTALFLGCRAPQLRHERPRRGTEARLATRRQRTNLKKRTFPALTIIRRYEW
ncbi:hypothetical protein RRG08_037395 [Elysia crispata]|uniref:Uncharacterized protein n=1 Tax=Elysia crispata TaxID=231223 RepID=A0AAE1DYF4_9GAST|nr:hypothetical protein RRG08_037395 [Elysia crispata]